MNRVRIFAPPWFKYLTGQEKLDYLNLLDSGKEIAVDVEYDNWGNVKSAKLARDGA